MEKGFSVAGLEEEEQSSGSAGRWSCSGEAWHNLLRFYVASEIGEDPKQREASDFTAERTLDEILGTGQRA